MLENIIQTMPREPGSYLLWLHLPQARDLSIGKLGTFNFPAGNIIYLGSARGPGGLRARLGRHLRGDGQLHWHIDYLRAVSQPRGFGYQISAMHLPGALHLSSRECDWSQRLAALPEASLPAPGFGASDCRTGCAAHLVHFAGNLQPLLERITDQIGIPLRTI